MAKVTVKKKKKQAEEPKGQYIEKRPDLNTLSLSGVPKKKTHHLERAAWKQKSRQINDEVLENICNSIATGMSRMDACRQLGIKPENLRKQMRRDYEVERAIEIAEMVCKHHHLSRIHSGEKEWRASAWFLSRKWWSEFALRTPDSYTREQVMTMIMGLGRIIVEEISDEDDRKRAMARISDLTGTLNSAPRHKMGTDDIEDSND